MLRLPLYWTLMLIPLKSWYTLTMWVLCFPYLKALIKCTLRLDACACFSCMKAGQHSRSINLIIGTSSGPLLSPVSSQSTLCFAYILNSKWRLDKVLSSEAKELVPSNVFLITFLWILGQTCQILLFSPLKSWTERK